MCCHLLAGGCSNNSIKLDMSLDSLHKYFCFKANISSIMAVEACEQKVATLFDMIEFFFIE